MSPANDSTRAMSQAGIFPRLKIGGLLGYAAIWAFFGIFLIYPLIRLFYDAFTTTEGVFTLGNFIDFFTDSYYLKSLVNSILLGWCHRHHHLHYRNRHRLPALAI